METLITPAIFLPKDDKKDISKINTEVKDEDLIEEDFKDKEKEKSLFETYTTQLKTPEIFKKDLNVDFEDNPARLYDKPKTDFINDVRYGWNQSQSGFFI